jgi:hypothetical protein
MEQNKFRAFVDEVAIIKKTKRYAKPHKVIQIIENEFGEEELIETFEVDEDSNPTTPIEIEDLKPIERLCELGCGKIVSNQVVEKRLSITPRRHWRTHCHTCHAFVHPDGVTIVEGAHKIQSIFMAYFNEQNK